MLWEIVDRRLRRFVGTGDMSWEFGNEKNLPKLLRYERQLGELFLRQPMLCGICQYHSELLPHQILGVAEPRTGSCSRGDHHAVNPFFDCVGLTGHQI